MFRSIAALQHIVEPVRSCTATTSEIQWCAARARQQSISTVGGESETANENEVYTCAQVVTALCLASASTAGPAALTLKATMEASAAAASCTSDCVTGPIPE